MRDLDTNFLDFNEDMTKELNAYDALRKQPIWEMARVKARRCLMLLSEEVP